LSLLGGALYGVLRAEAGLARKMIGNATGEPPDATGWYGRGNVGSVITITLLGDSSAAGYGVESVPETPGAVIASGVAAESGHRIYLKSYAKVGAQSSDLSGQIDRALTLEPEIAVIFVGANDVTHTVLPSQSVRFLGEGVTRLVEAGVQVVVGTCPDLGTVRPIPPPLKQVARAWSRRLAAAQSITVVEAGGRTVSLAAILGPEFDAAPAVLFGPDQFHPSADGYRALAQVVVPSVLASLGVIEGDEETLERWRGERVLPIARAAVEAAQESGTELGGTEVGGSRRGLRGRWVELRHRRRGPDTEVESPESDDTPPTPVDPEPDQTGTGS